MAEQKDDQRQGGLTARGEAVAAGYAALSDPNTGDDTLTVPQDQPTGTDDAGQDQPDAEQTGEAEKDPAPEASALVPDPATVETADDAGAAVREVRVTPDS